MSWWVSLNDEDGGCVQVGKGVDSSTEASLNVTYNYGMCFRLIPGWKKNFKGVLNGRKAKDAIPILEAGVSFLGTVQYKKDYWAPTPGNAGHALSLLLGWAREWPEAVFRVD